MKLKTRQSHNSGWTKRTLSRHTRRPGMPQHTSTLPAELAADAAYKRAENIKFFKRLRELPRKPMTHAVLVALGLVTAGCGGVIDTSNTAQVTDRPGPNFYVHEFILKDGTRCVISTSGLADGGTGVTCDWKGETLERAQWEFQ